ncbi:MAG: Nif3-like dinuclear metal center hexameric protein [Crocinitomicaceae bacterium]|nr:Nif3-like dinuclear metal center hexameric protein [Crocinitomicaceae bacterium]
MRIREVIHYLESLAPLSSQESYDNSGLIVGDANTEVRAALISLDCTEDIIDEALRKNCNLIIAHHPIVFKGLKSFTGRNYVERTVIKAIKNDIAIYAIHTNLDNYLNGVNFEIGNHLGLQNLKILAPTSDALTKLVVYCPEKEADNLRDTLFEAGAGNIGNYSDCSYNLVGEGTYKGNENSNPTLGVKGNRHSEKEIRIEVLVSKHRETNVVNAMLQAHPYEEVAYDLIPLKNKNKYEGAGMIGEYAEPMETEDFLKHLKEVFQVPCIRHTALVKNRIRKVAFCGGSGSFLLGKARSKQADIYVTGDFKYHEFFDAEDQIIIADIGHYESEQYTKNLLYDILSKKFPKFAVHLAEISTNPINYF